MDIKSAGFVTRLLDVIEQDIVPVTRAGVAGGSKIFGAAILRKSDWSLVLAGTNNEVENPLWHGEVHTLKKFYEIREIFFYLGFADASVGKYVL